MLDPNNIRIVLCSPEGEANMGSVARSMACFGLTNLHLVTPHRIPDESAFNWACHGSEILHNCKIDDSLDQALEGVTFALGLTRRPGKHRYRMQSLEEMNDELISEHSTEKIALLFGTEQSGLSNDELDRCHRLVTIPSLGSLNLAHSVSITLYEMFGRPRQIKCLSPQSKDLADADLKSRIFKAIGDHLKALDYPSHKASLQEEMTKFSDILNRAELEIWETQFLAGMFKQIRGRYEKYKAVAETFKEKKNQ